MNVLLRNLLPVFIHESLVVALLGRRFGVLRRPKPLLKLDCKLGLHRGGRRLRPEASNQVKPLGPGGK